MKRISLGNFPLNVAFGTLYARELCTIGAGAQQGKRIGNQIRIHKIVCTFDCGGPAVDVFLLKSSDETSPNYSDFYGAPTGGVLNDLDTSPFTTLRHFYRTGDMHSGKFVYNNPRGILVQYGGEFSVDCIKNNFWLVFKNSTPGDRTISQETVVYYTDCQTLN